MKKKHLILTSSIVIFASIVYIIFFDRHPFVKSTNLRNESLAGVYLMQQADVPPLEKELVKFTSENAYEKGIRGLVFDNPPYYADVQADKDNQIIGIFVGYPNKSSNTKFKTSRGIGSDSTFSDVLKAYGNKYYKKTYRSFMGSGDGYFITYIDKERNTSIEFDFSNGDPYSNKKEEFISHITLKKILD